MARGASLMTTVGLLMVCANVSWAQQADSQAGATGAEPVIGPLTGAELFTPGFEGPQAGSYLLPSLEWTMYGNTNPNVSAGQSTIVAMGTSIGSLSLQRVGKHNQLNLDYAGGAFFYVSPLAASGKTGPGTSGTLQELSFLPRFSWRRWKLLLGDQSTYLPETANGYYGFGGLTSFDSGQGSGFYSSAFAVNPTLAPSQTILTGLSRRLSNMALAEIEYSVGERSVITATGTYGTLHFLDPGYIDNGIWSFLIGYNHMMSRRTEIGITCDQTSFRFGSLNQQQLYRSLMLDYGIQLAGKLSLQLSGGLGANQVTASPVGPVTKAFWSTFVSLLYRSEKVNAQMIYSHYLSGGSGVLIGAETNGAQLMLSRQLSRKFNGSLDFGYQHNQPLSQVTILQPQTRYAYWQGGGSLNYEMGRYTSFYINYSLQREVTNAPVCFTSNCGTVFLRQIAGMGLNLHARPIKIR